MKRFTFRVVLGGSAVLFVFLLIGAFALQTRAFTGPSQVGGSGSGLIGTDSYGNVSIGNASPVTGVRLLVVGSTTDSNGYSLEVVNSNQTPLLMVRNDGAVAIGTSTYSAGTVNIGSNVTMSGTISAGGLTGTMSAGNISSGQFGANTGGGNYSFAGNVLIGTTSTGAKLTVNGAGSLTVTGGRAAGSDYQNSAFTIGYDNSAGNAWAQGYGASAVTSLLLNPLGGSVGIGTTAPLAQLTVGAGSISDANVPIQISSAGAGTMRYVGANKNGSYGLLLGYDNATTYTGSTISGAVIRQVAADPMYFIVNNTTIAETILSNGSVGIGTTSPGVTLDVNGDARIAIGSALRLAGSSSASDAQYSIHVPNTSGPPMRFATDADSSTNRHFQFGYYSSNNYAGTWNPALDINPISGNVSVSGTLTASGFSGPLTGTESAGNVSAGTFGANTGNGNYTFPAALTVNGAAYLSGILGVGNGNEIWGMNAGQALWIDYRSYDGATSAGATTYIGNGKAGAVLTVTSGSAVGIGTTGPNAKLEVTGGAAMTAGWNRTMMLTDSFPGIIFNSTAGSHYYAGINYDSTSNFNIRVGATSNDIYASGVNAISINGTNGYVGINGNPGTTLDVNGTFRENGNWTISGAAQASLNLNGNNLTGVNKIYVTTIDPVYNIDGAQYATYGPESVGIMVTQDGKGKLAAADGAGGARGYAYTIDFANAAEGSDLWLFWQTIDAGVGMENVTLMLTPEGGDASLWYALDPAAKAIVIHGDRPVAFSYHLSAPRYDAAKWPNVLTGTMAVPGEGVTLTAK